MLPGFSFAQKTIKGTVTDEKGNPVPAASIFLSNTSVGTTANGQGYFELFIPAGKHDLVVSSVGFETYSNIIDVKELKDFITIRLTTKAKELETVIIEPFEKNGWAKWGNFFLQSFIGTSSYATECTIRNKEVIHFKNSIKNNELTAIASEPLIIENKALGYSIRYQLEEFSYNFETHLLFYQGYPFFQQMKGSSSRKRKWEKRRKDIYYGSMMHFMRSIYVNTIKNEGFEVRSLIKEPNLEKQRIKKIYELRRHELQSGGNKAITLINDSSQYFERILSQKDYFDIIGKNILPGDSIAYAADSTTAVLDFNNYLLVIYRNKTAPAEYQQQFPQSSSAMMSELTLMHNKPISVQSNGNYFSPADLEIQGYWSWSEKIAMILPFDFTP